MAARNYISHRPWIRFRETTCIICGTVFKAKKNRS